MRFATPMVCFLAAGLAILTQGTTASAEAERGHPRPGRLIGPLGAGGADHPIDSAVRHIEERLARRSGPLVGVEERHLVGHSVAADAPARGEWGPFSVAADLGMVPLEKGGLAHASRRNGGPAVAGRGTGMVIAALGPGRGGSLVDSAPLTWGEPGHLRWAPGPGVPGLWSEPSVKNGILEAKTPILEAPAPAARPPARVRPFAAKTYRSEPGQLAMSGLPSPGQIWSRPGDPLAALSDWELGWESADKQTPETPAFIMPFANGRVTSLFNQGRRHPAIDLAGPLGTPVVATTSSQRIVFAGRRGGYGNAVITLDRQGRAHLYGHLNSITSRVGQVLDQGQKLGHLGSTGHSTGPHVHYEVRDGKGGHINPVTLLFPGRVVARGYAWHGTQPLRVAANVAGQPRPR